MIIDAVPYLNESDILLLRMHELSPVVDKFLVCEAQETFGGDGKPLNLLADWEKFAEFHNRIVPLFLNELHPIPFGKITRQMGREREAYQRDAMLPKLRELAKPEDAVIFADCDEIPSADAVRRALPLLKDGPVRFKQRTYYYSTRWLTDYGHDWASRARVGTLAQIEAAGGPYKFRHSPAREIEDGGWQFSYFGGHERVKRKVAALAPFLKEYKLFGDHDLRECVAEGRDLHHRHCELPAQFIECAPLDPNLPAYLLANQERFRHFIHG